MITLSPRNKVSTHFDNIEDGIFGRVGLAVGILAGGEDVASDKVGTELKAHYIFENLRQGWEE